MSAGDAGALDRLHASPRIPLAHLPTPLEPCHRLRDAIGGPLVWLKRDDCTGLAVGGNKTRKLEYLLADAVAHGADTVVTFGALQSNHARQTAAACARTGLRCELILTRAVDRSDEHYSSCGNLLLDRLLGARVHVVDDAEAALERFVELSSAAEAEGRVVHGIPPGGSDPVGTLGYVTAGVELVEQFGRAGITPDSVVVAASTAGTAAGLAVGLALAGRDVSVDAACVYEDGDSTAAALEPLVTATSGRLGTDPAAARWSLDDRQLGDGYGVPTAASREAIELLATTEGVLLDPVYTAKAAAHLLQGIRDGDHAEDADVVMVHTGGSPGLFAYAGDWAQPGATV